MGNLSGAGAVVEAIIKDSQATISSPPERVRVAEPVQIRKSAVTAGGIKNGYINIKPIDDFWPSECLGGNTEPASKHLIVDFEGVGRITTDISGRHKHLRSAHQATIEFFQVHKLKAGDILEVIRLKAYEYRIRPAKKGALP